MAALGQAAITVSTPSTVPPARIAHSVLRVISPTASVAAAADSRTGSGCPAVACGHMTKGATSAVGDRPVPGWAQRVLRYTAVSVLPALVAPLVMWPQATAGQPDPVRLSAAAATLAVGLMTRSTLWAIVAGGTVLGLGVGLA